MIVDLTEVEQISPIEAAVTLSVGKKFLNDLEYEALFSEVRRQLCRFRIPLHELEHEPVFWKSGDLHILPSRLQQR